MGKLKGGYCRFFLVQVLTPDRIVLLTRVFPDPDRFDIERTLNNLMAFGRGIRFLPGAPLARLEARIATQTILRRTKVMHPDPDGVRERVDNALFRGLKRFPVVVELADAA